jgi:hypothetical protein
MLNEEVGCVLDFAIIVLILAGLIGMFVITFKKKD